jgi:hypothetical protein
MPAKNRANMQGQLTSYIRARLIALSTINDIVAAKPLGDKLKGLFKSEDLVNPLNCFD